MRAIAFERTSKMCAGLGVGHQVEVALAVALLDVLQAVPLLGRRAQRLREDGQLAHFDRRLAGLRAEQVAGDAEEVAEVDLLEQRVRVGAERLLLEVGLDAAAAVPQVDEGCLAHAAQRHDSARRP